MNRLDWRWSARTLAALLLTLTLGACASQDTSHYQIQRQLQGPYNLDRVVDGDTIRVHTSDGSLRVRLIGIDTPEDTTEIQPYGPEATQYVTNLLANGEVYLEMDVESHDVYDRLLAYVYIPDPNGAWADQAGRTYTQINHAVAWAGLAQQMTIQPNSQYANIYHHAIKDARANKRGMWTDLQ